MEIDGGHTVGHDNCSVPEHAALDVSICEHEELKREIEDLPKQLEQAKVNSRFGLQRCAVVMYHSRIVRFNRIFFVNRSNQFT